MIVRSGTLTMYAPAHDRQADEDDDDETRDGCAVQSFGPGQAFVHPPSVHNFVNTGTGPVDFDVVYFVPRLPS